MGLFVKAIRRPGGREVEVEHSSSGILSESIILSNEQILALGASGLGEGVDLVDAPGVGFFLNYLGGFITISAADHPYTGVGNGTLAVSYSDQSSASVSLTEGEIPYLFGGDGEKAMSQLPTYQGPNYLDASQCENLALVLEAAALGVLGGGHVDNSGRVKVFYTIETLP